MLSIRDPIHGFIRTDELESALLNSRPMQRLRYITNFDWSPTHSLEADLKLWWPHGETLYALLLAWDLTGRCLPLIRRRKARASTWKSTG